MLLPSEDQTELVEAILERSVPSADFVAEQMRTVERRMENVRTGTSKLIPADEAHESVLSSLRIRA
jgi:hypothetical protein